VFLAWIDLARSTHGFVPAWDAPALERTLLAARRAVTTMEQLGTPFGLCVATCQLTIVCCALGCDDEAIENAMRCFAMPAPAAVHEYTKLFLAQLKLQRGCTTEAVELAESVRDSTDQSIARLLRLVSAQIRAAEERWGQALADALPCLDAEIAPLRRVAGITIARAQFGLGQFEAAAVTLDRAAAEPDLDTTAGIDSELWLTRAEVLHALGKRADAHAVLREARDRVLNTAAAFEDPRLRTAFANIASNLRVLALSKAWFGAGGR
jgi:tetratricopeptide (TPR) repeat protein